MVNIKVRVKHLINKYGSRDPETLARQLGITIIKMPFSKVMGLFKKELRRKYILVNSNLDEDTQRLVIAHELGHAILHSSSNDLYLHEYTLFSRGKVEIQANKFAAELLIDENKLDNHSIDEMTTSNLASFYGVPEQLIKYKYL